MIDPLIQMGYVKKSTSHIQYFRVIKQFSMEDRISNLPVEYYISFV
jgi:hypothetical protein